MRAGLPEHTLRSLLRDTDVIASRGPLDVVVRAITCDSRTVEAGDVFVCLPGYKTEGGEVRADRHAFIPQALERGAVALVVEREPLVPVPHEIAVARVGDCWRAVAAMACTYYDHPSRSLVLAGVTGTSGKTSTTYVIESVLAAAGHRTARLGTIEYKLGEAVLPAAQTTPEAPALQALLRRATDTGLNAVVMEVSSHALELRRVQGIAFDVAVFTNLSQDHLNFHPDMHSYLRAKGRLFEELSGGGKDAVAVVNDDDPAATYIKKVNGGRLLTYGLGAPSDVRATAVETSRTGTRFRLHTPGGEDDVRVPHLGDYSVHNALAGAATGVALGLSRAEIAAGLEAAPPVPGRFEIIDSGQDFLVIVDYAHKPAALERVLQSARSLRPHRLIAVFGCGGDRDRGKRPIMGRIAAHLCDRVLVTSDNPRSEDPAQIISEIVRGVDTDRSHVEVEPDRAVAIRRAIGMAEPGDAIVIAGKGHETYQLLGSRRIDFDDHAVARSALIERAHGGVR